MPTLDVLVPRGFAPIPPIAEALRVLPTAKRLGSDRIRVVHLDGALNAEFTVEAVERFRARHGIVLQPHTLAKRGIDWEPRRIIIPGADLRPATRKGV